MMIPKNYRSRILQYFNEETLKKIEKVVNYKRENDNNVKADMIMKILDEANLDFDELGTGTNRTAIFIDGYVFKIALDALGVRDNDQEFTLSEELQPYVIKCYECNGLIMVCEYVTVIARDEFKELKRSIREILKDMSQEYLLGDIGTIEKNFANWGYRDGSELVALDFAYIYRIVGNELHCRKCDEAPILKYTPDYDKLTCPCCRKQYSFMDIRRSISKEMETRELILSKEGSIKISHPVEEVMIEDETQDDKPEDTGLTYLYGLMDQIYYEKNIKNKDEIKGDEDMETIFDTEFAKNRFNKEADSEVKANEFADEIALLMARKNGEDISAKVEEHEREFEDENESIGDIFRNATRDSEDAAMYYRKSDEIIESIQNGDLEKQTEADELAEEIEQLERYYQSSNKPSTNSKPVNNQVNKKKHNQMSKKHDSTTYDTNNLDEETKESVNAIESFFENKFNGTTVINDEDELLEYLNSLPIKINFDFYAMSIIAVKDSEDDDTFVSVIQHKEDDVEITETTVEVEEVVTETTTEVEVNPTEEEVKSDIVVEVEGDSKESVEEAVEEIREAVETETGKVPDEEVIVTKINNGEVKHVPLTEAIEEEENTVQPEPQQEEEKGCSDTSCCNCTTRQTCLQSSVENPEIKQCGSNESKDCGDCLNYNSCNEDCTQCVCVDVCEFSSNGSSRQFLEGTFVPEAEGMNSGDIFTVGYEEDDEEDSDDVQKMAQSLQNYFNGGGVNYDEEPEDNSDIYYSNEEQCELTDEERKELYGEYIDKIQIPE